MSPCPGDRIPSPDSLRIHLPHSTYPPGDVAVDYFVVNGTPVEFMYGEPAVIEHWQTDEWVEVYPPRGDNISYPSIGLIASPSAARHHVTHLTDAAPGCYRVVRGGLEEGAIGFFEVTSGAEPSPPQPRRDARMEIAEPLVAPGPVTVDLVTLEPAGRIEDEEKFQARLPMAAAIDRWNGQEWLRVSEHELRRVEDGGNVFTVRFEVPRLDEGVYRVVRGSPNGDYEGLLWVTTPPWL